jgi:hypothetical protein
MRRYPPISAAIAVSALVLAAPAAAVTTAPSAPRAARHVLTIGTLGGMAVAPKAVLKAGLANGASAVFSLPGLILTCKRAAFGKTVTTNPVAPGTAKLSATNQTFTKCGVSITGGTVNSVIAKNLPYNVTASDAKGDPVQVSERKKADPITFSATVEVEGQPVTCSYKAVSIDGSFSNKTNIVTFIKQHFIESAGGELCPHGPALFSAKFGPITDSSVKGNPKIFVN